MKKITFQYLTEEGIKSIGTAVETMAEAEELHGHKNAMTLRLASVTKASLTTASTDSLLEEGASPNSTSPSLEEGTVLEREAGGETGEETTEQAIAKATDRTAEEKVEERRPENDQNETE